MDCPYCKSIPFVGNKRQTFPDNPFNEVFFKGPGNVITPTIGMFLRGHLLSVSTKHIPSFACYEIVLLKYIQKYINMLIEFLSSIFGKYCIFEHGVGLFDKRLEKGQTIDHAHLHLVPITEEVNIRILKKQDWMKVESFSDIINFKSQGYLFYSFDYNYYLCSGVDVENQWIRKVIYNCLGIEAKHWDWREYPGISELNETKRIIEGIL